MTEKQHEKLTIRQRLLRMLIGSSPKKTLIRTGVVAAAAFILFRFILFPVRVNGISMEPTYRNGGFNLINMMSYTAAEPRRGDVVAIRLAGKSVSYLKRIIGMPGETVEFRNGQLFINNKLYDEPYIKPGGEWNSPEPRSVGEDTYYVAGDNRSMDMESHVQGIVQRKRILGRPLF